jgi:hypothetical protein
MQRYLVIFLMFGLAACSANTASKNQQAKDSTSHMLSTDLVSNPNTANGVDSTQMNDMATIDFKDTLHEFGTIQEGEIVEYDFSFVNNGKKPLVIASTSVTCGCTIPLYPHDPIPPGQGGIIKVKFNSASKSGHQDKSVTVFSNARRAATMLYIKGDVTATKEKE